MATVSATSLGARRVECAHEQRGVRLIADAPTDNQGQGASFSPPELCAAALGARAMTTSGIDAQSHGVDVTGAKNAYCQDHERQSAPHRQGGGGL